MGREVMRVPLDFEWPLSKVWKGYTHPEKFREDNCPDCELGITRRAQRLYNKFYGNAPFDPAETGSTPVTRDHPAIRARAERNVSQDQAFYLRHHGYYGTVAELHEELGEDPVELTIQSEGNRLAALANARWSCHLSQADVDGLVASERGISELTHEWVTDEEGKRHHQRIDPAPVITAEQVNALQVADSWGHGVEVYATVEQRCKREGIQFLCPTCDGQGSLERYPGQREEAEKWEREDPPKGEGWQLWETVSEGSPISPVFPDAEGLAQWMASPAYRWGAAKSSPPMSIENARAFVGSGWAPSMVFTPEKGLQDGAVWVAETASKEKPE